MVRAGQTLRGKFRVDALLGQGGMASVWQGTHLVTGRRIALKVLDDRFLSNAGVVARFGREARAASAIHHESIVDVIDLDRTEEGAPFLVMEFLEGETLTARIERVGRLSEEELVALADPLLDAVHAAHEAGVVHRDLKPDNIMLVRAGRRGEKVKVLDFGISSKADEVSSLTQTGSLLGTPHYMSPEQARGRTDVDRRADVYAIGVLLYECAVGDVPFDADNYNALIQEILHTAPEPPRARGAQISEAVEEILSRAIAKNRDERPQTADAMREQLLLVGKQRVPAGSTGAFAAVGASPLPPVGMPIAVSVPLVKTPAIPQRKAGAVPPPPPSSRAMPPAGVPASGTDVSDRPVSRSAMPQPGVLTERTRGGVPASGTGVSDRPVSRSAMPTLDGSDIALEPIVDVSAAKTALPKSEPVVRSSGPRFDTLSGSRGEKLELDVDAVRKTKARPVSLSARPSARLTPEPEAPPPNRWLRVGIGVVCVAVLLIVVVRFAVRPEWILSIAGASSP